MFDERSTSRADAPLYEQQNVASILTTFDLTSWNGQAGDHAVFFS